MSPSGTVGCSTISAAPSLGRCVPPGRRAKKPGCGLCCAVSLSLAGDVVKDGQVLLSKGGAEGEGTKE